MRSKGPPFFPVRKPVLAHPVAWPTGISRALADILILWGLCLYMSCEEPGKQLCTAGLHSRGLNLSTLLSSFPASLLVKGSWDAAGSLGWPLLSQTFRGSEEQPQLWFIYLLFLFKVNSRNQRPYRLWYFSTCPSVPVFLPKPCVLWLSLIYCPWTLTLREERNSVSASVISLGLWKAPPLLISSLIFLP